MGVIRKLWKWINDNISILLFIGIIGCIGGIILSYIFVNESITALGYNMDDSTARTEVLGEDTVLEYNLLTEEKLLGVQVRLTNFNKPIDSGNIHYEITSQEDGHVLGSSFISAVGFVDGNYIFMPFDNFETCIGSLTLTIWTEGITGINYPGVYLNTQDIPNVNTVIDGDVKQGNLLIIYNTPLYNKPLLWDFVMLLAILSSVFAITNKEGKWSNRLLNRMRKRETVYEKVERE